MTLLQTVQASDVLFRPTDVVIIVSGIISVLTAWFMLKSDVREANTSLSSRIDLEVSRGDEKRKAITREFELHVEKHKALEERIKSVESNFTELEMGLAKDVKDLTQTVNNLALSIEKMKSEILQQILNSSQK